MIYHLTSPIEWSLAQQQGTYSAPSLDSEGFIHCSSKEQILMVANNFYSNESELIVLCIDESKLKSLVKWEAPAHPDGSTREDDDVQKFPHVYGIIHLEAINSFRKMPKDTEGFHLPEGI